MTRAVDLLKNKFGVSQLYKHDVKQDDEIILTIYWHPLTIAEREAIQKKTTSEDPNEFNPEIFNFQRIRLAPTVIIFGFILVIYSILHNGKKWKK